MTEAAALHGVLVTYRRPDELANTLAAIAGQTRRLDRLVVVDNAPAPGTEELVRARTDAAGLVDYVPMTDNAGFSGGLATGTEKVLKDAREQDWVVVLDDDDPPYASDVFEDLLNFATAMVERNPATGAVGVKGARFDWRRGHAVRVSNSAIEPVTPVDYISGCGFPFYRVGALRRVGSFADDLFFSFEDLEIGLRLIRGGFGLYVDGSMLAERRTTNQRPDVLIERSWRVAAPDWRSYYSLRNTIVILRRSGMRRVALRVSLVRGLLKPLLNLPIAPRNAIRTLVQNWRAAWDGWLGRLGRRVEPQAEKARPNKVIPVAAPADWATSKEAR